jgi:hypothetical protein
MYSLYAITHDVDGKFLDRATDEDISDLLKEMSMTAAHKVELRNAIASWRSDPQQTMRILENARNAAAAAKLETEREAALKSEQDALDVIENAKGCHNCVIMFSCALGIFMFCAFKDCGKGNKDFPLVLGGLFFVGAFLIEIFFRVLGKIAYGEKFIFFSRFTVFGGGF